ncbi:MAG: T9SS type A sorting domain-containing protein, partial [Saprospiraceae bacterium]
MQYDFKWVYGSILMDWFGVPEDKVKMLLTDDFQYLPIIGTCNEIPTSTNELVSILETKAFPNPFDQVFTLSFSILKKENVRIHLFDVMGKTIRTISNKRFTEGKHNVLVETHSLPSGVYFARVEVGNGVKSLRVVKK